MIRSNISWNNWIDNEKNVNPTEEYLLLGFVEVFATITTESRIKLKYSLLWYEDEGEER